MSMILWEFDFEFFALEEDYTTELVISTANVLVSTTSAEVSIASLEVKTATESLVYIRRSVAKRIAMGRKKKGEIFFEMKRNERGIDREDLETLWKLVKAKHKNTRPEEDYERVLWGDLKVMFKPDIKSEVWRNLQGYKVTVWKLFDNCGVHFIQKMNIKFRGGLLGLKDFKMILRVTTAQLQLLEGLMLSEMRSKTYERRDKGTIPTVLSLAASRHWPVHQLDVKNAFLHGDLSKTVYMHQPLGFRDSSHPNYVCLLQRSLYGLKQAPRAWFQWFASYITRVGFHHSRYLLHRIISSLHLEFAMTDLGSLNYFLGISVARDSSGMFLSQKKYAVEILERAGMVNCNPSRTPVDTESKLGTIGDVVSNPTMYQSLAGSLQYLTFTRLDISYAVQQVCLHMHDPQEPYFSALKRILRYICGYCVFLGNNLLSWSSKRQPTLSRSSAEAEYHEVANAVVETYWLRNLLRELHTPLSSDTLVYCDNVSAVYLSCNPVQHQRTKHVEIDIHFVWDLVAAGEVQVLHVPSHYQFAYSFTKGLPSALFEEFRSSLSFRSPPAPTAGEC
ncbi:ribonuclease H-like domain-containing protein [Tanacetum coccineum]